MSFRTALAVRNLLFPANSTKPKSPEEPGLNVVLHYRLRFLNNPMSFRTALAVRNLLFPANSTKTKSPEDPGPLCRAALPAPLSIYTHVIPNCFSCEEPAFPHKKPKAPEFFVAHCHMLGSLKIPHVIPNCFSGEEPAFPKKSPKTKSPEDSWLLVKK